MVLREFSAAGYAADARSKTLAIVIELLIARPEFRLDPQTTETTTLLHAACRSLVPMHIVQRLLDLGSDPNVFDKFVILPLSYAINGRTHMAEMLLKHGADPFKRPSPEAWDLLKRDRKNIGTRLQVHEATPNFAQ